MFEACGRVISFRIVFKVGVKNKRAMIRRSGFVFVLFFFLSLLWGGAAFSQCIPVWTPVASGVSDGEGNRVLYKQDFEDPCKTYESLNDNAKFKLAWEQRNNVQPAGWAMNTQYGEVSYSSNNVFIQWMIKAQGGDQLPRNSFSGKLHLRYYALDDKAHSGIILPGIDLRKNGVNKAKLPLLKFRFASPKRTDCDKLVVKFRLEKYGELGGWRTLAVYQEQNENFVLKTISLADAIKNFRKNNDNGAPTTVPEDKLKNVELYFEGWTKLGGGLNIDDVMIVDADANPIKVNQSSYLQLTNPLGASTKVNELARVFFDVSSGSGYYKLGKFTLNFKGDKITDVDNFHLYHTTTPYFTSASENKFCDLEKNGTTLTLKASSLPNDVNHRIRSGQHYFWIVADLASGATLKDKISVELPVDGIELKYFNEPVTEGVETPQTSGDVKYPKTAQYDEKKFGIVYACLAQETFDESGAASHWNLASPWLIGEPMHTLESTKHKTAPTRAYSEKNVLATAQKYAGQGADKDKLDGQYADGLHFGEGTQAKYTKSEGIDAQYYKDVRFKAKFCLNSTPEDKFRLVIITDKDPSAGILQDIETVVWENSTRTTMTGWNTMNVDISNAATRNKKFRFRFDLDTKSDGETQSGLFIDDIQILGALIQKDLGVVKVEVPKSFQLSQEKLKVTIKNFGKEEITKGYEIIVTINGKEKKFDFTDHVAAGAEVSKELEVALGSTENDYNVSHEKQVVVEVKLKDDTDDEESNNIYTTKYYDYPTYPIKAISNANPPERYPVKSAFDRLMHWYPEATSQMYSSSWTEAPLERHEKFKNKPQYRKDVPYSYQVWTTGLPHCMTNEHSSLTGPIFDLKDQNTKKELIVGFIYEKDLTSSPAKFWFEYTTNGKDWNKLKAETGKWSSNWYSSGQEYWSLGSEAWDGFKLAKVELPIDHGKIQFRAMFESGAPIAGVTISGFEIREMRPDLQVVELTPKIDPNNCEKLGTQKLKFKLKNNGPTELQAFHCPATIRVYDYLKKDAYTSNALSDNTLFKLLGEHVLSLQVPQISVNAETMIETDIEYPWDVSDFGYKIVVELHPELASPFRPDENTENNTYSGDIVSRVPYFPVIRDLVNVEPPQELVYYVENYSKNIEVLKDQTKYHFYVDPSCNWTVVSGSATPGSDKRIISVAADSELKLSYVLKSNYPNYMTQNCPAKDLRFKVKKTDVKFRVASVTYKDQEASTSANGCYMANGETVEVKVDVLGSKQPTTVELYINGKKQSVTVSQKSNPANKAVVFTLSGVKFPKGYSQVEIVAVGEGNANLSNYSYNYHEDRLYRTVVPSSENLKIYWRNKALPESITPVAPDGYVNNYVGELELYVAPVPGVKYEWYKGGAGVMSYQPDQFTKIEDATTNVLPLKEESATYVVKLRYGKCGEVTSRVIHVRSDDLELVDFSGIASTGICASQGSVPLLIDVRNNSRTMYVEGTELKFHLKVTGKTNGTVVKYDQDFTYRLAVSMTPQAVNTLDILTLTNSQFAQGENLFELKFLGIVQGSTVVKDGNEDNNTLTSLVGVRPSPEVKMVPAEIEQKFSSVDTYTIKPKYSGSQAVNYQWYSKNDEDEKFIDEAGNTPNFTITGMPKDEYKVVAKNAEGCTAEAVVKFVQTDLSLARIMSPASACDLGASSYDYVELLFANTGSKAIKGENLKLKVKITLDNQVLRDNAGQDEHEELFPIALRETGKEHSIRVTVKGLKEKLSAKTPTPHNLIVEYRLEGAKDIDAKNNKQDVQLTSFGNPTFTMAYYLKDATQDATQQGQEIDIENGSKLIFYSDGKTEADKALKTKFLFKNPIPSAANYNWSFGVDNTLSSIQSIYDNDQELLDKEVQLPNKFTRDESKDKLGSGFYYLTMRTDNGCEFRQYFELVVYNKDLELAGIEPPRSQCEFPKDKPVPLKIQVRNAGNQTIAKDTKFKVTCEVYDSEAMATAKETLTQEVTLGQDMLQKGIQTVTMQLKMGDAPLFYDGGTKYFKASVEFVSEEDKKREFNKDNNTFQSKKNGSEWTCTVTDYADVTISAVMAKASNQTGSATAMLPSPAPSNTYSYENTGSPSPTVLLSVDNTNCTYAWKLGFGLHPKENTGEAPIPNEADVPRDKQKITVTGAGRFELSLESTKEGKCKAHFSGNIATTGNDIYIGEVLKPTVTSCLEQSNSDIEFYVRSNKTIDLVEPSGQEAGFQFTYSLKKKGTPTDLLGSSHGICTVTFKDIVSKFNSGLDTKKFEEKKDYRVNLSSLTGVKVPQLTEAGEYELEISFTVTGEFLSKQCDEITENNRRLYLITYLGEAASDIQDFGESTWNFYTSEKVLKFTDPKYDSYTDFLWEFPNGDKKAGGERGEITITEPGQYMLSFKDGNGCAGKLKSKLDIHFPGYLQLEPDIETHTAIIAPVEGCDIMNNPPTLRFKVKNVGKEPLQLTDGEVKVNMKNWNFADPTEPTATTAISGKNEAKKTLEAGEVAEYETVDKLTFKKEYMLNGNEVMGVDQWHFVIELDKSVDGSHAPGLNIEHPKASAVVTNNPLPTRPDLEKQAKDYLESHGVSSPNLLEIERGTTFNLDALGNALIDKYEWVAPQDDETLKTKQTLLFNKSGKYQVKITSAKGCISQSAEVTLSYKVNYEITPALQGDDAPVCIKGESTLSDHIVKVSVTVTKADEVIPAGTEFHFEYQVKNEHGSAVGNKVEETYVTTENYAEGKTLTYTFTQPAKMPKGLNKIELKCWFIYAGTKTIEGLGSKTLDYVVGPSVVLPEKIEEHGKSAKIAPIVTGGSGRLTYYWNGTEGGAELPDVSQGTYEFEVVDEKGCRAKKTTTVLVTQTLSITVSGEGKVEVHQYTADNSQFEGGLLTNGSRIIRGRKLKVLIIPSAEKKYYLDYFQVNGDKISVEKTGKDYISEPVAGDVNLEVGFKQGAKPNVVEDVRLTRVVCISPVVSQLVMYNTGDVVSYEVLNLNGVSVLQGKNQSGAEQLSTDASHLQPGLYLIRIYAANGVSHTLKFVKE